MLIEIIHLSLPYHDAHEAPQIDTTPEPGPHHHHYPSLRAPSPVRPPAAMPPADDHPHAGAAFLMRISQYLCL